MQVTSAPRFTSNFHDAKTNPVADFAKFARACEHNEMAYVIEMLLESLWECKSKKWEMKVRLCTHRTLWPQQNQHSLILIQWPWSARPQAQIRDTGLIYPQSKFHVIYTDIVFLYYTTTIQFNYCLVIPN